MKTENKQKTTVQSAMIRLVFYLKGQCVDNPVLTNLNLEVLQSSYFPLAFKYCEDYNHQSYEMALGQMLNNPQKILHLLPIKETGYYELVGMLNCTLIFNEKNELVDSIWKIKDSKFYQLTEEESEVFIKKSA